MSNDKNNTTNNSDEEIVNVSTKDTYETYKAVTNMLKDLNYIIDQQWKILVDAVKSGGYNQSIIETLLPITEDYIQTAPIDELKEFTISQLNPSDKDYEEVKKDIMSVNTDDETDFRNVLLNLKSQVMDYWNGVDERNKLLDETSSEMDTYLNYLNNSTEKHSNEDIISKMEETVNSKEDGLEKKLLERRYEEIKAALSLSFITERLEKYGRKEIDSIKKGFFGSKNGEYDMKKFNNKITKYGYSESLFKHFIALEETFLEEKYHPFNNLFLFIYMRYIAYSDPYNGPYSKYIRFLTSSMSSLIYHKFENNEAKEEFLNVMRKTLDFFMDDVEEFKAKNQTYKTKEEIDKLKLEKETKTKAIVTEKLKNLGVTDDISDKTSDELLSLYKETISKLVELNKKEDKSENDKNNILEEDYEEE
jgi:hypothetical protein